MGNDAVSVVSQMPTFLRVSLPTLERDPATSVIDNYSKNEHTTTEIPRSLHIRLNIQNL